MRSRDAGLDAALLALLMGLGLAGAPLTVAVHGDGLGTGPVWVATALQVATAPAILLRRRWPVAAGVALAGSAVVQTLVVLTAPAGPASTFLSVSAWAPIALSLSIEHLTERDIGLPRSAPVWGLVGLLTVLTTRPWQPDVGVVVNGLLHSAVAPLAGLYLAARRRLLQVLRDRAERAEREQLLLAEQARAEERGRLAAEIHDLVAHRVTLMVLQAGALGATTPDPATRGAAEELRANGARALDELRELVGLLRGGGRDGAPAVDERPVPALADLARDATLVGQPVRLTEEGEAAPVTPVVGRTAHRVVQEALTNARKHAEGAAVRVRVAYRPDGVRISVRNDPSDARSGSLAGKGGGTGLAGLRERVELLGGSLLAGAEADGGFRVEAVLPARVGP